MIALFARRAARAIATLVALAIAAWLCLEAAPGEPAEAAARAAGLLPEETSGAPAELRRRIVAGVASRHGLDRPPVERLGRFLAGAAHGDLGRSWRDGRSVAGEVARALPTTLALVFAGLALAYALGVAAALFAASSPGGARDRLVALVAALALAIPTAWGAVLALRTFSSGSPFRWVSPAGWTALPIATMAYVAAAAIARHGRASLIEAAALPMAVAARARGASHGRVLGVHALGVSASTLASLIAYVVPHLLGAALVVERAFDLHGLGALLLDAARAGDAPVVLGATLAAGLVVAAASLLADALAVAADPRLRGAP